MFANSEMHLKGHDETSTPDPMQTYCTGNGVESRLFRLRCCVTGYLVGRGRFLGQDGLPYVAGLVSVKVGEYEIKDFRVPACRVALETFLDILYVKWTISMVSSQWGSWVLTSGSSSQSDMLSAGKIIILAPARRAATAFSRKPPMRSTLPVTVNSPVMAMVGSSCWSNASERSELAMVMPAEGPESN